MMKFCLSKQLISILMCVLSYYQHTYILILVQVSSVNIFFTKVILNLVLFSSVVVTSSTTTTHEKLFVSLNEMTVKWWLIIAFTLKQRLSLALQMETGKNSLVFFVYTKRSMVYRNSFNISRP